MQYSLQFLDNFWMYEVEQIILEEGDWHGRIVCDQFDSNDQSMVCQFANVEKAVINKELSKQGEIVVDIYFQNLRNIYRDMPFISKQLGLEKDSIQYHSLFLSRYFIHDPEDKTPPLLLALYLAILIIVMLSLILIIRGSFELSMNARIHQFGIFASIGATPKQIRNCLLQEAVLLSIIPMILGSLLGIFISSGLIEAVNIFAANVSKHHKSVFHYSPFILIFTILASVLTVFFSAWIPARKLSKITPIEAIQNTGGLLLKKRKHSRMLVFMTLSDISTRYTYFERYQDMWDIMITLKDTELSDFGLTDKLQDISSIQDAAVYQKAKAMTFLSEGLQSDELLSLGGFESITGAQKAEGQFQISVPIIILDDTSFLNFCSQIKITPSLDGAIILNQIWDSINSNFRYKKYIPFITEKNQTTIFYKNDKSVEIPILSYTQTAPMICNSYRIVCCTCLLYWRKTSFTVQFK